MLDKSPDLKTSTWQNLFLSHSATYWQQKAIGATLYCTTPGRFTISPSNLVSKTLRPWWCVIVKIVSFHGTLLLWQCIICHETGSCFWGARMLKNSWNFPHTLEEMKINIWRGLQHYVLQNGSLASPTKFQQSSPRCTFHRDSWNWQLELSHLQESYFNKLLLEN